MSNAFWERMHGGSTHFPFALILASFLFDLLGCVWPAESRRRHFHAAGFCTLLLGAAGSLGAVASGLILTNWTLLGSGLMEKHHLFIWPSFALMIGLAIWRITLGVERPGRAFKVYLLLMSLTVLLINAGAFFGGEMLLRAKLRPRSSGPSSNASQMPLTAAAARGRDVYLANCAHCHAEDATGDEGPDLHGVKKSDERIAQIIKGGIKGEMPKFGAKLNDEQVSQLIAYLRSLRRSSAQPF